MGQGGWWQSHLSCNPTQQAATQICSALFKYCYFINKLQLNKKQNFPSLHIIVMRVVLKKNYWLISLSNKHDKWQWLAILTTLLWHCYQKLNPLNPLQEKERVRKKQLSDIVKEEDSPSSPPSTYAINAVYTGRVKLNFHQYFIYLLLYFCV